MIFEVGKRYYTRSGMPVRIICVNRKNNCGYDIVGLVSCIGGVEETRVYCKSGKLHSGDSDLDIVSEWIEPPKKVMHAPALLKDSLGYNLSMCFYTSKEQAIAEEGESMVVCWPAYNADWPMLEEKQT